MKKEPKEQKEPKLIVQEETENLRNNVQDKKETIKSERLRYKNADEIY